MKKSEEDKKKKRKRHAVPDYGGQTALSQREKNEHLPNKESLTGEKKTEPHNRDLYTGPAAKERKTAHPKPTRAESWEKERWGKRPKLAGGGLG